MDYEKKYKEALERARALRNEAIEKEYVVDYIKDYETIFPELRESEDEITRKRIINLIRELASATVPIMTGGYFVDGQDKKYIAYLEKQKENIEKEYVFRPLAGTDITIAAEQAIKRANEGDRLVLAFNGWYVPVDKHATTKGLVDSYNTFLEKQKINTEGDFGRGYDCGYQAGYTVAKNERKPKVATATLDSEKQKEQKPAEWSKEDEDHLKWLCRIIHSRRVNGELSLAEESELGKWMDKWINHEPQPVQKWDEFDKDCLKRAIWYVEYPDPSVVKDTNLVLWLESLPERFNLQPKQEWSKEDEKNLELVTDCVYEFYPDPVMKYKLKDWLKSLHPSWKPSKEQMDAIDRCVDYLEESDNEDAEIMESLQEQLNQLKQ